MRVANFFNYRFLLFLVAAAAASFMLLPTSFAAHHGGMGMHGAPGHQCEHHPGHGEKQGHAGHGAMQGRRGEHHGRHGEHHGRGGHHGKKLYGPHWKTSLSPEQANELDRLRVEYAKAKMPLKAKAKAIKLELAALATADEPDQAAISARIDELLALKREMMGHKYRHIAAKRKVLTPEQRVSFDLDVLKRIKHKHKHKGKKGR